MAKNPTSTFSSPGPSKTPRLFLIVVSAGLFVGAFIGLVIVKASPAAKPPAAMASSFAAPDAHPTPGELRGLVEQALQGLTKRERPRAP